MLRRGFTIIELMMIITILAILAAIVVPAMTAAESDSRVNSMAATAKHIRDLIQVHASRGDVELSPQGFPLTIDTAWFKEQRLPEHMWTERPLNVSVVTLGTDVVFPAVKWYDPAAANPVTAWYNTASGAFCVLVPPGSDDAQTLARFNAANSATATSLIQVNPS